jgi:hypothetical protein
MDALAGHAHHARVRVLPHIKRLDDYFGQFLVRVVCRREILSQPMVRFSRGSFEGYGVACTLS